MTKYRLMFLVALLSVSFAHAQTNRSVLYSSLGAELTQYDVDAANATLTKKSSIRLPANVQYAWQHPSKKYFYVAWSDGGAAAASAGAAVVPKGSLHGVTAFAIDPQSGALRQIGQPVSLPARPIHLSVDPAGTHVLIAYNVPSSLTVHKINPDGTLGAQVSQPAPLDTGIYAHQIRPEPSGKDVIMVTRGNVATKTKPEDRGGVKLYSYADGVLKNRASVAPNGGVNFQPRHLDYDPSQRWIYLSLEAQSKLQVYALGKDGAMSANPLFTKDSLADSSRKALRQNAGTLHVHPNGRFLYQANRSAIPDANGRPVGANGENSIAVYSINQQTGEPTRIQNIDTHGGEPRTFSLDPSARLLVVGNQTAIYDGSGPNAKVVPSSLAVYRIGADGKLEYVRKYDVSSGKESLFWMGIVALP